MFPPNWDPCSITLALLLRIFILFAWVFLFSKESQGSLLICIVQFSRCCFVFRSLAEHFYYITFRRFCQVLFQVFSKFSFVIFAALLQTSFFYYITFSSVCQVLFQVFLKNFSAVTASPFRPAFLLYHFQVFLSSTFFKFFQNFFPVTRHTSYRATFILYHLSAVLSSTFFKKIKNFCKLNFPKSKNISDFLLYSTSRPTALLLYHAFPQLSTQSSPTFSTLFCLKPLQQVSTKKANRSSPWYFIFSPPASPYYCGYGSLEDSQ